MFCVNCNNDKDFEIKVEDETYNVKGQPITIQANVAYCKACGEQVWNDELDSQNLLKAFEIYRQKNQLLSPEEIKRIRDKYGISQATFSRILGVGEKTITRYENGSIQDKAINNLIESMNFPDIFEYFLNKCRDILKPEEYAKASAALNLLHPTIVYNKTEKPYHLVTIANSYWGGMAHVE